MKIFTVYILLISSVGIILTVVDKLRSQKGKWRIRERTLFIFALLGGSLPMFVTMNLIRHKTQKKSFMLLFPLIAIIQIASVLFLLQNFLT